MSPDGGAAVPGLAGVRGENVKDWAKIGTDELHFWLYSCKEKSCYDHIMTGIIITMNASNK